MLQADLRTTAVKVLTGQGVNAGQYVVDRINDAIRNCDMESAHFWDEVGGMIDEEGSKLLVVQTSKRTLI